MTESRLKITPLKERARLLKKMGDDMYEALGIIGTMAHNMQNHILLWEAEDNKPERSNP